MKAASLGHTHLVLPGPVVSDCTRLDVNLQAAVKDSLCLIRTRADVGRPIQLPKDRYDAQAGNLCEPETTLSPIGLCPQTTKCVRCRWCP